MKTYVVIDADSINGSPAQRLMHELIPKEQMAEFAVVGKNSAVLQYYDNLIKHNFPSASVRFEQVTSLANHADIVCGYWVGRYTEQLVSKNESGCIAIISHDKLVIAVGAQALNAGLHLILLNTPHQKNIPYEEDYVRTIDVESKTEKSSEESTKEYRFPSWFGATLSSSEKKIGLKCLQVGSEEIGLKPEYIPFPIGHSKITIGTNGDIPLAIWDLPNGLYPKNAEFEHMSFPNSTWTIRSLRGMRRGTKEIKVNGKTISAESGSVHISSGDIIDLGTFRFEFITDKKEELIRFAEPAIIIRDIETRLASFVSHYTFRIPERVEREISVDGIPDWSKAFLLDYQKLISHNWENPHIAPFRSHFVSEWDFFNTYRRINTIRNVVMHPSKGAVDESQKSDLVNFYIKLLHILENS